MPYDLSGGDKMGKVLWILDTYNKFYKTIITTAIYCGNEC